MEYSISLKKIGIKKFQDIKLRMNRTSPIFITDSYLQIGYFLDFIKGLDEDNVELDLELKNNLKDLTINSIIKNHFKIMKSEKRNEGFNSVSLDSFMIENSDDKLFSITEGFIEELKKTKDRFLKFLNGVEDFGYTFRYVSNKRLIPVLYKHLNEEVFSKIDDHELFYKKIYSFLDEYRVNLQIDLKKYDFEDQCFVYTVDKDIDLEKLMKTKNFPIPEKFYLANIAIQNDRDHSYNYIFTKDLEYYKNSNNFAGRTLNILINENNSTFIRNENIYQMANLQYDKDVAVFSKKEDAESYYQNTLMELRVKINSLLNQDVIII